MLAGLPEQYCTGTADMGECVTMRGKKALFITPADMYDNFGNGGVKGSQKNYKLIEGYFGRENTYLCTFPRKTDVPPPEGAITWKRSQSAFGQLIAALFGCKVYFPWNEKKLLAFIHDKNIDLLFIDSSVLGRLAKAAKRFRYRTIVFFHNIEADYAWNKAKNEGMQFLPSYWASRYNDKCGAKADMVMCLNTRDSARLERLYHRKADFLLPVTFSDAFDEKRISASYKNEILFLGSFFTPNQISLEWFLEEVMPKLHNIHLNIVGKGFEIKREEYERNGNVTVIGSVKELDGYYYRHCAVVLPIRLGAGMKVKTAEAMMYGRRIFASDEALEGYDVEGTEGITRCNTAQEYITAINRYFGEGCLKSYEPAVRELFLKKYETESVRAGFEQCLDKLLLRKEPG